MKPRSLLMLSLALGVAAAVVAIASVASGPAGASTTGSASVSAGTSFTCAVTSDGGIKCWGSNQYGQLGNGTNVDSILPGLVAGFTSGGSKVSAGSTHACALTTTGAVKCWGRNDYGQLGNGTETNSTVPVSVTGLSSGVVAVSAGSRHTCALTMSGSVKCWGRREGTGQSMETSTPTDVSGASGVASISAGGDLTCIVTTGHGAKCWGNDGGGKLGDGMPTQSSTIPVNVTGLTTGVAKVSAGHDHACAVTTTGAVKCWGHNDVGQLGNGTMSGPETCYPGQEPINGFACSTTPDDVTGMSSGVSAVDAGDEHTCARTAGGAAACWGRNSSGELGDGTTTNSTVPVNVSGQASGVGSTDAGDAHSCLLTTAAGIKCWGANTFGALGNGTSVSSSVPVDVSKAPGPPPVTPTDTSTPTNTSTPTSTATSTPLPPKDPDLDTDGDTIVNSVDPDDDNDTCPDADETQLAAGAELTGGRRNPHDANDYFNPSHDGVNRVDDILLVVNQYFDDDSDGNPGLPPYAPGYNPDTDRTLVGPLPWNLGAPNGQQRVDDILNVVKQYFHDCS